MSGSANTASGVDALFRNTTGYENTARRAQAFGFMFWLTLNRL